MRDVVDVLVCWATGRTPYSAEIESPQTLPPTPPNPIELPASPSPAPKEPEPQNRDYRKPPPFVEFNDVDTCTPKPCRVEPTQGSVNGGVRVTIHGKFLTKRIEDVEEIRLCGVLCKDIKVESSGDEAICNITNSEEEEEEEVIRRRRKGVVRFGEKLKRRT